MSQATILAEITAIATLPMTGPEDAAIAQAALATAIQNGIDASGGGGGGGVSSVGATAPLTSTGGTTPTIAIPAATASVPGYMTTAQASAVAALGTASTHASGDFDAAGSAAAAQSAAIAAAASDATTKANAAQAAAIAASDTAGAAAAALAAAEAYSDAADVLVEAAAASDATGKASAAQAAAIAASCQRASNLSDVANTATARANLGLGTAATQASTAFDPAGAAAAAAAASVPTSRTITATAPLTIAATTSADLSADRTVALSIGSGLTTSGGALVPDFGTAAGKVAQGNDTRIVGAVQTGDARLPATPSAAGRILIDTGAAVGYTAAGTANQVLVSQGAAAPIWVSMTAPAESAIMAYQPRVWVDTRALLAWYGAGNAAGKYSDRAGLLAMQTPGSTPPTVNLRGSTAVLRGDGVNDVYSTNSQIALNSSAGVTFACVFYNTNSSATAANLAVLDPTTAAPFIFFSAQDGVAGKPRVFANPAGANQRTGSAYVNVWTRIVMVVNYAAAAADEIKIYVSGILANDAVVNTANNTGTFGDSRLHLFARGDTTYPFQGDIAQPMLFPFAMSATQAADLDAALAAITGV